MSKISNKENNENIGVSPRKTARLSTNKENTNECSKVERVRKVLGLSTNKLQDVKDDVDDTATSKSTKTDDVISKEEESSSTKSIDDVIGSNQVKLSFFFYKEPSFLKHIPKM